MDKKEIARQLNLLMIEKMKDSGAIRSAAVETTFRSVPRHRLLPPEISLSEVYADTAIVLKRSTGIGFVPVGTPSSSSTMPSLLAAMLEAAELRNGLRVLQIGTGPGYLVALIAGLVAPSGLVATIEIDEETAAVARERLSALGVVNIHYRTGDGFFGYPELAPFDRIIVTAACADLPASWIDQLSPGGLLFLPLSFARQSGQYPMVVFEKRGTALWGRVVPGLVGVGFLPLYGESIPHPVVYEPSIARLEMELSARLSRDGHRRTDAQVLYLLAVLCVAESVERFPEGIETMDIEPAHRKASDFLKNHRQPRVAGFSFRLTGCGEGPASYEWHFAKGNHEISVGYEEERYDTPETSQPR